MSQTVYDKVFQDGVLVSSTPRILSDREIYLSSLPDTIAGGPLANLTPDQADTWIDANVTTIAGARTALKILARIVLAMRDRQT